MPSHFLTTPPPDTRLALRPPGTQFRRTLTIVLTAVLMWSSLFTMTQAHALHTVRNGTPAVTASSFAAPVPGHTVRAYQPGPQRWSRAHRGVDLRTNPPELVHAAGPGVITYAGVLVNRPLVVIDHGPSPLVPAGEHLYTVYEPITPTVQVGDIVHRGDPIGRSIAGHAGCHGTCLHWGAHWSHGHSIGYLNPWLLLDTLPLSLLPWVD